MKNGGEDMSQAQEKLDVERLSNVEPYEVIENPVLGQEFRFLERGTDADGEFFRVEIRYEPDAKSLAEHIHVKQEETFGVLSGKLVVTIAEDELTVGEGEEITLPAGVPHYHGNASGVETRVFYEIRPALNTEKIFRTFAALARDGRTNPDGVPNLLQLAVILDTYPGQYITGPPIVVQKALFKLLAPVGRLRGYKAEYPKSEHIAAR